MIFIVYTTKKAHISKLEDILKALLKNGLKISPRKCQLFKTELQDMGNILRYPQESVNYSKQNYRTWATSYL